MKVGLQIPSYSWSGGDAQIGVRLAELVQAADEIGFDSIWVMDHFFQIRGVGRPEEPMLEGWTTLGYLAALTRRAHLGLMVGGVAYRAPALWIKAATTLDVLTGGRAYLGLGAAWNEDEARSLGFAFPPLSERFELLEDTLRMAHGMWSGERGTDESFQGHRVRAERLLNSPQALRRPHPPILVGGGGERKTLRLVAQYADATNVFGGPDQIRHKYEVLRRHCQAVGRNYDEIEKTNLNSFTLDTAGLDGESHAARSAGLAPPRVTPTQIVQRLGEWAEAGSQHTIFSIRDLDLRKLERLGHTVVPQAHDIGSAAMTGAATMGALP